MEYVPVYTNNFANASRYGEEVLWKASLHENEMCAKDIEMQLAKKPDKLGLMNLAEDMIALYGEDRVSWTLANSIQKRYWEKRFPESYRQWSSYFRIPFDVTECGERYIIGGDPEMLTGLVDEVRDWYLRKGLHGAEETVYASKSRSYRDELVLLFPSCVGEAYHNNGNNQYFVVESGDGCDPYTYGTRLNGYFLEDHEPACINRCQVMGIADEDKMPPAMAAKWHGILRQKALDWEYTERMDDVT